MKEISGWELGKREKKSGVGENGAIDRGLRVGREKKIGVIERVVKRRSGRERGG